MRNCFKGHWIFWMMRLVPYFQHSFDLGDMPLEIDARVFCFAVALAVFTSFASGLFPAFVASRSELYKDLREGRSANRQKSFLRRSMVVVQIAVSLILLVGAGLFLRTLWSMSAVDPGFRVENLLLLSVEPLYSTGSKLGHGFDAKKGMEFYRRSLLRIREIPGVEEAGWSTSAPLGNSLVASVAVEERAFKGKPDWTFIENSIVTQGYLKVMGITVLAGRDFSDQDNDKSPRVMIINQTMARRFWPNANPIGKKLLVIPGPYPVAPGYSGKKHESFEVIGIAKDVKYSTLWEERKPYAYFLIYQRYSPNGGVLYVRGRTNSASLLASAKAEIRVLAPDILIYEGLSGSGQLALALSQQRAGAFLLGACGVLAVVLASVGLYGLMSYSVVLRRNEFGIRTAIGAKELDIIGLVFKEGMLLVLLGIAIGVPCSLGLSTFIAGSLHGIKPTDPVTYIGVSILFMLIACGSLYLPAKRSICSPMAALRCE
jgi:predicted permease